MRATDHGRPYTGAVLNEKAYAARRRLKVDDGDLVGMLGIVESTSGRLMNPREGKSEERRRSVVLGV